jgi:hypothetical protein
MEHPAKRFAALAPSEISENRHMGRALQGAIPHRAMDKFYRQRSAVLRCLPSQRSRVKSLTISPGFGPVLEPSSPEGVRGGSK